MDNYKIGDITIMKKGHPCGCNEWEVLRTGADFRIKCRGCGHLVMLSRQKFEKAVKKVIGNTSNEENLQ